jgi:hypothetical protein
MKPLHTLRLILTVTVFAFASRLVVAQLLPSFKTGETAVITMKSGEKFEGKVLSDSPDSVEIEYRPLPKIIDKKIILKADIATVKKQRPSETEFAERGLGKLLPTPDLKDASFYESTIQDKLRTFVAKYPGTPEATEVEKIIAAFVEEKGKLVSGQLKVEGRWLPAATVQRDAYNIDAYRQYLVMKEKAAENTETHYLEALRAFERLRTDYRVSPYFLKAIPEAQDYLKQFDVQIAEMIKEAPILIKRREDGLKALQPNEAPVAKKAIEDEKRAYEEALSRQTKEKAKWRDIYKYDDKSLKYAQATIAKERGELAALDLAAVQADGAVILSAIRYIADKNIPEASAALDQAVKIKDQSYRPLIQSLTKQLIVLKENAKKELKAAAASASAAPEAAPEGDKSGANPVAEAMKKLQEEKQKKAAAKAADKKAGSGDAAGSGQAPGTPAPEPPPTLMEKLNDYLPLIGGGLVVVIGLAWFLGKKKKEKE